MIHEIIPGIYHWKTWYEEIEGYVHSYYVSSAEPAFVVDPRIPEEGLHWFDRHARPENAFLTNRLHFRDAPHYQDAFGTAAWCHWAGMHEFSRADGVRGFRHGEILPGGLEAWKVDHLCPEETGYYLPLAGGVLFLGDSVVRDERSRLSFVDDQLMGEDPEAVKEGLRRALRSFLEREIDHLLLAHGEPVISGAKEDLLRFLGSEKRPVGEETPAREGEG